MTRRPSSLQEKNMPQKGEQEKDRWARNRDHWNQTLDARNLQSGEGDLDAERETALYETADVRWTMDRFEPLRDRWVMDLGGGLALAATLFARRGARVVICDLSVERLKVASRFVQRMGLGDHIYFVVGSGEALPFATGSIDRVFTKSVLIHTDLAPTSGECGRVLARNGKAAFIEPMRRNPFVNLYRRLFAPKIWQDITTYFRHEEFAIVAKGVKRQHRDAHARLRPFYFTGFLASVFHFAIPNVTLMRLAEKIFGVIDGVLFTLFPGLKKNAWFSVLVVETKKGRSK